MLPTLPRDNNITNTQQFSIFVFSDDQCVKMLSIILGAILGALIYYKIVKPANFWDGKNITHVKSWPWIGSMWKFVIQKQHIMEIFNEIYNNYPNDRYVGFIQLNNTPCLLIRDIDLIKKIGVKDFENFQGHSTRVSPEIEPLLSKSLMNLTGEEWKQMRATLSPVFTTSKMKNMYHLIYDCSENFAKHFESREQEVEVKEIFSRFSTDVIASAAFGISVNSLEEPKNEFYTMGEALTTFKGFRILKLFLVMLVPKLAQLLQFTIFPKSVTNFFKSVVLDNMRRREKEGIVRPDLIHLLMEAKKGKLKYDHSNEPSDGFATVEESEIGKNTKQIELTDDFIVGQALLFFFAGFETISTSASFLVYELALNPDIQSKLQQEIDSVREANQGKISYSTIQSMKYLDQVVCENLRLWPPSTQGDRICNKDYRIEPIKAHEKTFTIQKDTPIVIPIFAIHRDSQYFPNPEKFDPERFSVENRSQILSGSYLPFGIGPRNCIGSRLALLELKTLFFHLLSKLDVVLSDKTPRSVKINPQSPSLLPKDGFHVVLRPRTVK